MSASAADGSRSTRSWWRRSSDCSPASSTFDRGRTGRDRRLVPRRCGTRWPRRASPGSRWPRTPVAPAVRSPTPWRCCAARAPRGAACPVAETGCARWLARGGRRLRDPRRADDGGAAHARPTTLTWRDGAVHGTTPPVAVGRAVDRIVALVDDPTGRSGRAGPARPDSVEIEPRANLAGEPRDSVHVRRASPRTPAHAVPAVDADALPPARLRCATASIGGCTRDAAPGSRSSTRTTRRQFGKPVGRFQAVQAHLVHGAQTRGARRWSRSPPATRRWKRAAAFEVAAAKLLATDRATATRPAHAHQAHGAMGMTREYPLHHFSRRLWAWRSEYGDERSWSRVVGDLACRSEPTGSTN